MKKTVVILLAFFMGMESCETDFEVNAPWRDITIVYGLLNQKENPHVIKINKAFLGEADVNDMAQIRDSSEYGADEITVKIQRSLNGSSYIDYGNLARYEASNKPAGTFYSPDHALYSFTDTLEPGYNYRLVITKTATGDQVFAETRIIEDKGFKFIPNSYWTADPTKVKVDFYKDGNYFTFNKAFWNTAVNGRRYQLTVRFHYTEINILTSQETPKSLDWVFPARTSADLDGGDEMGTEIDGEDFYKFIGSKLDPPPANIVRCIGRAAGLTNSAGQLDFIVDVAGEDFNTYLEVNEPSTGIVQERPEYTNVFDENGNEQVGFFSARYSISTESRLLSTDGIAGTSVTELKTGQYTGDLGFVTNTDPDISTCPL